MQIKDDGNYTVTRGDILAITVLGAVLGLLLTLWVQVAFSICHADYSRLNGSSCPHYCEHASELTVLRAQIDDLRQQQRRIGDWKCQPGWAGSYVFPAGQPEP
jgi:hypothetical protein